jgi:lysophospholipase L1-like esterase
MERSEFYPYAQRGLVNRGNWQKIKLCMKKAQLGQPVTVGFLGGSITQGSLSSTPETCYAYLVYEWWKQKFPRSKVTYVNAGVGGTTSQFGVARVKDDLLASDPDFVVIEFSVNDDPTDFFEETYEGLIRTVEESEAEPGVLLLHNIRYDTGISAEERHLKIGKAYGLPCVSMKQTLYPLVVSGHLTVAEISPDGLHPNDFGHRLVADTVIAFLENVYQDLEMAEEPIAALPAPITANRFQNSYRLQNYNSKPICSGFTEDTQTQNGAKDCFKRGWTASKKDASILFEFEGSGVAIQYRKSVRHPAPVALAILDGDEKQAVRLDANFEETWGDCLFITTMAQDLPKGKHRLEVRIVEAAPHPTADFYLVSVIVCQ